jgi:hypothetical protein
MIRYKFTVGCREPRQMVSGEAGLSIPVQATAVTNGLLGGCWWRIGGQGGVPAA